jgi:DNA-binding NarL/FixJ family response regulator
LRLVVAENDVLLREGLVSLFHDAGFDVVGQAGDGDRLLALVPDKTPDVVVADIRMRPTRRRKDSTPPRLSAMSFPVSASCCFSRASPMSSTQ